MQALTKILALSAGGIVGVNARYWLGVAIHRWVGTEFPWATFIINITGSFAIGFLGIALGSWSPHAHLRLLAVTGLLGGYTTFSTLAHDTVGLWQRGEWRLSVLNMVGSMIVGCAAVVMGAALANTLRAPVHSTIGADVLDESSARGRASKPR